MFFGGSKEPESVQFGDLAAMLRGEFNRKLAKLDSRASGIVNGVESFVRDFTGACDAFRELDKEPDLEYVRATSANYIRDQKGSYSNLLSRILSSDTKVDVRYDTIYDKYYDEIQRTGSLLNDVLKANAQFKMVLDAYPNDLNRFKRSFSAIEAQWRMLKSEVEARNSDFNEYHETLGKIQALGSLLDESRVLESTVAGLEGAPRHEIREDEIDEIRKKIESVRAQEQAISAKASSVNSEISILLHTVDKPARKHDYLSLYKPKLTPLLDDPSSLRNPDRYAEFYKQIGETKDEVEKGVIAVKNVAEVRGALEQILEGRLKSMLESITELEANKVPLDSEIRDLERVRNELESQLHGNSQRESNLAEMKARAVSIKDDIQRTKAEVESLFERHYKRKLRIGF